jgi:hypothetical protein
VYFARFIESNAIAAPASLQFSRLAIDVEADGEAGPHTRNAVDRLIFGEPDGFELASAGIALNDLRSLSSEPGSMVGNV